MATFTDTKERTWEVRIDAPTILRIREECDPKFMLGDDTENNTYDRLDADPVLLCRVIFILCDKQRNERGISEEDFYLHVIGDAIDSASDAMLAAIVGFTPRRTREFLAASVAKKSKLQTKAVQNALARINDPVLEEKILAGVEQKIDAEINRLLTQLGSHSDSPVSLASTPQD